MSEWNKLPNKEIVEKTAASLRENGFDVTVVSGAIEAKEAALKLIPEKSEVFCYDIGYRGIHRSGR